MLNAAIDNSLGKHALLKSAIDDFFGKHALLKSAIDDFFGKHTLLNSATDDFFGKHTLLNSANDDSPGKHTLLNSANDNSLGKHTLLKSAIDNSLGKHALLKSANDDFFGKHTLLKSANDDYRFGVNLITVLINPIVHLKPYFMLQPEKFFENPFSNKRITHFRLANFAGDCISRLTAQNSDGVFNGVIDNITKARTALQAQLGYEDTSLTIQKGKTQTVQQLTTGFKKIMSEKEGVIADALGGFDTPAYLEFYPHGVSDYSKATLTKLPVLLKRINTAATAHATQLPAALATQLQNFETNWNVLHTDQQQTKGMVSENRSDKAVARPPLEMALFSTLHIVAQLYPGNVQQCMSLFDFSLLEAVAHHKKNTSSSRPSPHSGEGS